MLTICDWKHGKRWVYSITYDEALSELHRFAVPIHEEFGIPGHVEAVAGHIGRVRQLGQSSYNGFHHMGPEELRDLVARGWGVGNHSWSHEIITPETVDREIRQAKEVLEEAIDGPVRLYCSPGDNTNMADHVLAACRASGYLGAMSLTDDLNRPDEELFWINRTPLHDQYYGPFFSAFDPYRNFTHAEKERGWVIDYCHCPLEAPVHRNKDCSEAQLRRRFEVLCNEYDDVWCANPDEVIDYHLTRRHTRIETVCETTREYRYRLALPDLPPGVGSRALTLRAEVPAAWCQNPVVRIDGEPRPAELLSPRCLRFTVLAADRMEIVLRRS
jgi:peptidoglycan/xylan/chitin deacetylase (PgdA/CDA1 family)